LDEINKFKGEKIAFCTHNIVLRSLIGLSLRMPKKEWHKINVPYGRPISFVLAPNKSIYLDCDEETLLLIMRNFPNG
jgi:bisphosphoglycerate-dependent phosphoglycerate mutase